MGFRKQISEPNKVGEWIRAYRQKHDMSGVDLQRMFDIEGTLGIPITRVEVTTSPMTKVVSQPVIDYFDGDVDLIRAFKKHNLEKLHDTYEL